MTASLCRTVVLPVLALVALAAGPAALARPDVPLPRRAPESIKPDQHAQSNPETGAVVQPSGQPRPSPVIGAKAADFQRVQNWTVKCRTSGERRCILYQTVLFGDENPSVIVARAGYVQGLSDPVLEVRVPMGVRLATGLTLAIDDQPAVTLPFERCAQDGCVAQATLHADLLAKLRSGQTLDFRVEDQARNAIRVRMSLVGFSTALGMAAEG